MSYSVKTETNDKGIWTVSATRTGNLTKVTASTSPVVTLHSSRAVTPVPNRSVTQQETPFNLTIPQIGNASSVYISAVKFDAPGDDRQNLNAEWVRLTNRGDGLVLLAGWTLSDKTGSLPYVFPAFVLMPQSSVTIYSGGGSMNDTSLFMGRDTPVWSNSGDVATLKDGHGTIIDQRSQGR
jgi:hypothetical protein